MEKRRSQPRTLKEKSTKFLLPLAFVGGLLLLTGTACNNDGNSIKCQDGKPPLKVNGTCPETTAFNYSHPLFQGLLSHLTAGNVIIAP